MNRERNSRARSWIASSPIATPRPCPLRSAASPRTRAALHRLRSWPRRPQSYSSSAQCRATGETICDLRSPPDIRLPCCVRPLLVLSSPKLIPKSRGGTATRCATCPERQRWVSELPRIGRKCADRCGLSKVQSLFCSRQVLDSFESSVRCDRPWIPYDLALRTLDLPSNRPHRFAARTGVFSSVSPTGLRGFALRRKISTASYFFCHSYRFRFFYVLSLPLL
jgi:hypothetical protein